MGEHQNIGEVVHKSTSRDKADEEDHAYGDCQFLACQGGTWSKQLQEGVDDQYEEDKRSQDGNGKEVAHQERAPDDHVIEKRKPAKYDYAEKA